VNMMVARRYEGHAATNYIKQNCLEISKFSARSRSSIMIDGNFCTTLIINSEGGQMAIIIIIISRC
jgi:ribosomal protein S27E